MLDWFVAHDDYQLIFAPHVMLFERRFVLTIDRLRVDRPGRIDEKYLRAPNIHIDLGSRAATTMAYTNRADIYLGDVSSQVYEFLRTPRPCVFLNPHWVWWEGDPNYAHWQAGPVVEQVADLGWALDNARQEHASGWRETQEELFSHSFDLTETPSSARAARALCAVAGLAWPQPPLAEPAPAPSPVVRPAASGPFDRQARPAMPAWPRSRRPRAAGASPASR